MIKGAPPTDQQAEATEARPSPRLPPPIKVRVSHEVSRGALTRWDQVAVHVAVALLPAARERDGELFGY